MEIEEVKKIFDLKKNSLIEGLVSSKLPMAFILGGQPACGKGNLVAIAKEKYPNIDFLVVNGDNYRIFHPDHKTLIRFPQLFSDETQIFSNVFTEGLIKEARDRSLNISVEGTMRNPQIPLNTASFFKEKGYRVEVLAISAPAIITEIGFYNRFQEEVNTFGTGRLADVESHNSAVEGLPNSLDTLYKNKSVDKIHIYSYLGEKKIKTFTLKNGVWDTTKKPSEYIKLSRENQLKDKLLLKEAIKRGELTISQINPNLKEKVLLVVDRLKKIEQKIEQQQSKTKGKKYK